MRYIMLYSLHQAAIRNMATKVKDKASVRISHDLQHKVAVIAAQRGITRTDAVETLLTIGLNVHNLIENGLILPKTS